MADRLKLFAEDGESPQDDVSKIEINHEFAKRYEHNKKREELQRYEELKKKGRVDSSSSDSEGSESEEEELIKPSKKKDFKFFDALIRVKNQDPILRNKDAKLFDSDDDNEGGGGGDDSDEKVKKENKKPMYLKDVVSKHLIEAGPEFDDDEDMENGDCSEMKNKVKSYSEEQEEIRREFLNAVGEENDEEGDFLRVKNSESKEDKDDDRDEIGGKLDEYFGEDEKLDENMMFLKDYFRNRMWIDDERGKGVDDNDIEFSEDEEAIEKQEDYEREYNFRFEENAGDRVMGHSRKVEGSVRKKDNVRKSQRERKDERMIQAEFERKEELKRMKNLKRKEINEKLEKIREVAGIGKDANVLLDVDDLDDEFDPDEYDRKMKEAFGDGYYEAEDVDPAFGSDDDEDGIGLEKPDFDKEDELLGLDKGLNDGFLSTRQKILKNRVNDESLDVSEDGDEAKEGKRKRKRKPSEVEKAVREELMDEYYKLDYEDTIGDLKTRFKYKPVKAKRYGLKTEEIFAMDDKDLNQYVSLKKLAPYTEKEWKVPRIKTIQLKQKSKGLNNGEKRVESERSKGGEDKSDLSRRSKRRRRQAELKLSRSRLIAYGKIPTKAKSKN